MSLFELVRGFARTFAAQRARTLLTLLGVMIGTGAVVALTGLLEGAKTSLAQMNQGVSETDTLRIHDRDPPRSQRGRATRPLSRADAEALATHPDLPGVLVTAESRKFTRAEYRGKDKRVRVMGLGPRALSMYRLELARGRFVDARDVQEGRRVAVLGFEVGKELFSDEPLGAQINVEGESWTVVGVLAHKPYPGHGTGTWMWDRRVIVPRTAFDASYGPSHPVQSIFLRLPSGPEVAKHVERAGRLAKAMLLRRHLGIENFELDDRSGQKQEQVIFLVIEILLVVTVLMSLLVGGINIMNIMLVTVTERTREIGIRRAVGASRRAIAAQFLFESALVASLGGVLGVLGGVLVTWLASLGLSAAFGSWAFFVEPWAVGASLALAVVTGVVFGLFPALRASRLNPVEALRAE